MLKFNQHAFYSVEALVDALNNVKRKSTVAYWKCLEIKPLERDARIVCPLCKGEFSYSNVSRHAHQTHQGKAGLVGEDRQEPLPLAGQGGIGFAATPRHHLRF